MLENLVLFKYGGNAMTDASLCKEVLQNICVLKKKGYNIILVHGGGPFIRELLAEVNIQSEFIDGQRKTTPEALEYVEMALKGKVNGKLVSLLNTMGVKAVGLSGKDGKSVIGKKRLHTQIKDGKEKVVDLGQVADVAKVNPELLSTLLKEDYLPVLTCLASDEEGNDYNINGDMFAGHLAGALGAKEYVILTDVDGLLKDKDKPETLIRAANLSDIKQLKEDGTIQGGMIPKIESCEIAIHQGAQGARIINGTVPEQLLHLFDDQEVGTLISQ